MRSRATVLLGHASNALYEPISRYGKLEFLVSSRVGLCLRWLLLVWLNPSVWCVRILCMLVWFDKHGYCSEEQWRDLLISPKRASLALDSWVALIRGMDSIYVCMRTLSQGSVWKWKYNLMFPYCWVMNVVLCQRVNSLESLGETFGVALQWSRRNSMAPVSGCLWWYPICITG